MTQIINVIATHDAVVFPDELVRVAVKLSEEIPQGFIAVVSPLSTIPTRLRVSNPTVFSTKFDISVANFEDGPYWDGIAGDLHGNLFDINDDKLPKWFFGSGERYSIAYEIKKGDVIAVAEVVKNGE